MSIRNFFRNVRKKIPYIQYLYPIYIASLFLAINLSKRSLEIIGPFPFSYIFHPFSLIFFVSVLPIVILMFYNELYRRDELNQLKIFKASHITIFFYGYLIYVVFLFYLFLNSVDPLTFVYVESEGINPILLYWGMAIFVPIMGIYILLNFLIRRNTPYLHKNTIYSENINGMENIDFRNHLTSERRKTDSLRYSLILFSVLILFGSLLIILLAISTEYSMYSSSPWFRSDAIIGLALILIFALAGLIGTLGAGILAFVLTLILIIRREKIKLLSQKYYLITASISLVFVLILAISPVIMNIQNTNLNQSYLNALSANDLLVSNSFSLYNESSQELGEFRFDVDTTYMLVLRIEQQKLPSRQFEILFSFINVSSEQRIEEPLMTEWGYSYAKINQQRIIGSAEIFMKGNPGFYNYVVTSLRLYFWNYMSLNEYIDLRIKGTISIDDDFPIIENLNLSLCFLKDPQDIIKREFDKRAILDDLVQYYLLFIFLPSFIPLVNSCLSIYLGYTTRKREK